MNKILFMKLLPFAILFLSGQAVASVETFNINQQGLSFYRLTLPGGGEVVINYNTSWTEDANSVTSYMDRTIYPDFFAPQTQYIGTQRWGESFTISSTGATLLGNDPMGGNIDSTTSLIGSTTSILTQDRLRISLSERIGSSERVSSGPNDLQGWSSGTSGYLGFVFYDSSSELHYGSLLMTLSNTVYPTMYSPELAYSSGQGSGFAKLQPGFNGSINVLSWSYETTPNLGLTLSSLAPIPEADTSAMLLTGLGVIGFMARRRRKTQALVSLN
jgi:hypothetical protein